MSPSVTARGRSCVVTARASDRTPRYRAITTAFCLAKCPKKVHRAPRLTESVFGYDSSLIGQSCFDSFIVLKYPSRIQLSLILQRIHVVSAQSAQRTVYQSDPIKRAIVPILAWTRLYRIPLLFQFLCQLSWVV
jgi:hypothetical protein